MKIPFFKKACLSILFVGTYIIPFLRTLVNEIVLHLQYFSIKLKRKRGGENLTKVEMLHALVDVGKKQTDLVREIESRYGEKMSSSELNLIMSGTQQGAKADRVRIEVEEIIKEWK